MALTSKRALIFNIFFPQTLFSKPRESLIFTLFLVLIGSLSLAVSAQYKVPIGPVPITLQSLVVLLLGAFYGWKLGAYTVVAYWLEGIVVGGFFGSVPWFANGSGLTYFLSAPSAGFLWGFLPMVMVIGILLDEFGWRTNLLKIITALILGQFFLYLFGLIYAYYLILPYVDWMNSSNDLINIYVMPYLLGDALKTGIVTIVTAQMVRVAQSKK